MILRSAIFFRALYLFPLLLAGQVIAGTVSGTVRLVDSHDPEVNKKKDFSGIVVWLEPLDRSFARLPRRQVEMVQKDKKFKPHVLAISTGSSVAFPNLDPIFHNAFSNFDGKIFDVGLYPPGSTKSIVFDKPGIVRVFCNIHPSMSAVIVVVDSPYFTITDESGNYSFANVVPGEYQLHFFHERATPETLASVLCKITVDQAQVTLTPIRISEAGYLPVAHKNKYGRDYPTNADQQRIYSNPAK